MLIYRCVHPGKHEREECNCLKQACLSWLSQCHYRQRGYLWQQTGNFREIEKQRQNQLKTRAFCPYFSMGLAFSKIGNNFVRLPSGRSPREAMVKVVEIGPLHKFLGKMWSELGLVGKLNANTA